VHGPKPRPGYVLLDSWHLPQAPEALACGKILTGSNFWDGRYAFFPHGMAYEILGGEDSYLVVAEKEIQMII
jgi:hypothetical protein